MTLPPRHARPVPAPVPPAPDWICSDGCGREYRRGSSLRDGKPCCPGCGRDAELFGEPYQAPALAAVVEIRRRA